MKCELLVIHTYAFLILNAIHSTESPTKLTDHKTSSVLSPKFLIFWALIIGNINHPPTLKGNIQEIEQENQDKARHKHGNWPKDPEKQRGREVESSKAKRPEIAPFVNIRSNIFDRSLVVVDILGHLLERHVDENAGVAVVPYGLNVKEEGHQETRQYAEVLDRKARVASVPEHEKGRFVFASVRHQHGDERAERDGRRG